MQKPFNIKLSNLARWTIESRPCQECTPHQAEKTLIHTNNHCVPTNQSSSTKFGEVAYTVPTIIHQVRQT